jgi:hypothetical protein
MIKDICHMIKRFLYFIVAFFFSVEFLIILIGLLLWFLNFDSTYAKISQVIFKSNDLSDIAVQIGIPITILGVSFSQFKYILQPDINLKIFYSWSDYIKLKDTFITGLIWNFLALLMSLIVVFILPNSNNEVKGALYVIPLISSIYSTLTIIFARQKLKEIIEKNKSDNTPST